MKRSLLGLATLALVLTGLGQANAGVFNNSTGIPSPITTINFTEVVLPASTPLTNQYSAYGVTFANLFYDSQFINGGGVSSPVAENFQPDPINGGFQQAINPFSIFFTTSQTDAAFAMITNNGGSATIEAYLSNVLVDSGVFATDSVNVNYYGVTGLTFDEIRVTVNNVTTNGAAAIDNIQIGSAPVNAVPEPSSLLVFGGLGLVGMVVAARRRKN